MKKKKNYMKLTLDLLMGITFALFFNKSVLGGLAFHEWAGVIFGGAILTHILLNATFVKKITLRLFDRALPGKTRFSYLLSFLLLLGMLFIIFSGLVISRVVWPSLEFGDARWFKISHLAISYVTLALIGVHIGMYWHWVMKMFNSFLHFRFSKLISRIILITLAILVVGFGVYQFNATNYWNKMLMVQDVFTTSSSAPAGIEGEKPAFDGDRPALPDGERPMRGKHHEHEEGHHPTFAGNGAEGGFEKHGGEGDTNFLWVIAEYFGIIAIFAAVTHYLMKLWDRGSKRRKSNE
jgi:hypothetical protein